MAIVAIGAGGSVLIMLNADTGVFVPWAAAGVITVFMISLGTKLLRRLSADRKGRLGERLVTGRLSSLSDDYWLVNDVMLPGGRGNLDHVVIGPCGVVVIETKRVAGRIRCYGDEWSSTSKHQPAGQLRSDSRPLLPHGTSS